MVDASEHQDSNSRDDDDDDDGCHDSQCGHAVVWQLISCEEREKFIVCGRSIKSSESF